MFQKPRVGVLSTGNEVVNPGQPLAAGQIYDSNRTTLMAAVKEQGLVAMDLGIARDKCVYDIYSEVYHAIIFDFSAASLWYHVLAGA